MLSGDINLSSLALAGLLTQSLGGASSLLPSNGKPPEAKTTAATGSVDMSERTAIDNEYTKVVIALLNDYGTGLDPDCNPLRNFGAKHDSDDDIRLRVLEWVKLRKKHTKVDRVTSNVQYSIFIRRIDAFLERHHESNLVGTQDIANSGNLLLQLLKDIYVLIEGKYGKRGDEGKITQLEVIRSLITGITITTNIWQNDVALMERVKRTLVNVTHIDKLIKELANSEHSIEFSLLLPELDDEIYTCLQPLYKSFNRNLLPNAYDGLCHDQSKVLIPQSADLILYSVTDQPLDKCKDLLLDKPILRQLSQKDMTFAKYLKTDTAKKGLGLILAQHENLFALARNLIAPEVSAILVELRREAAKTALQLHQQAPAQGESKQETRPATASSAVELPIEEMALTQHRSYLRIQQLKLAYKEALEKLFSDNAIASYLPPAVKAALANTNQDDTVKYDAALNYKNAVKMLIITYHKQKQLFDLNQKGSILAAHINTLLPLIMPKKIGELSTLNLVFYTHFNNALDEMKAAAKVLRDHNSDLRENNGWLANAQRAWSTATQLSGHIQTETFHYIQQINLALTKKHIQDNSRELLETLAQFSVELSLAGINPGESQLEASLKSLLIEVYKTTETIPDAPTDAYLLEDHLAHGVTRITQRQLEQSLSRSIFLFHILTIPNQLVKKQNSYYLHFNNGRHYLLENENTAKWIESFKAKAGRTLSLTSAASKSSSLLTDNSTEIVEFHVEPRRQDLNDLQRVDDLNKRIEELKQELETITKDKPKFNRHEDLSAKFSQWRVCLTLVGIPLYILAKVYRWVKQRDIDKDLDTLETLIAKEKAITDEIANMNTQVQDILKEIKVRAQEETDLAEAQQKQKPAPKEISLSLGQTSSTLFSTSSSSRSLSSSSSSRENWLPTALLNRLNTKDVETLLHTKNADLPKLLLPLLAQIEGAEPFLKDSEALTSLCSELLDRLLTQHDFTKAVSALLKQAKDRHEDKLYSFDPTELPGVFNEAFDQIFKQQPYNERVKDYLVKVLAPMTLEEQRPKMQAGSAPPKSSMK